MLTFGVPSNFALDMFHNGWGDELEKFREIKRIQEQTNEYRYLRCS